MSKILNWTEVLKGDWEEVIVLSYGYMERSLLTSHFEPFKSQKRIPFVIKRYMNNNRIDGYLYHKWLDLEDNESNLQFKLEDNVLYLNDPDLFTRI